VNAADRRAAIKRIQEEMVRLDQELIEAKNTLWKLIQECPHSVQKKEADSTNPGVENMRCSICQQLLGGRQYRKDS
jgi:uncharacterized UBP type Zn finger protein